MILNEQDITVITDVGRLIRQLDRLVVSGYFQSLSYAKNAVEKCFSQNVVLFL